MSINKTKTSKIALLSGTYPPCQCGVGQYTKHLKDGLEKSGIQVAVITDIEWKLRSLNKIKKILKQESVDVVHFQYPTSTYGRGLGLIFLLRSIRYILRKKLIITVHEYLTFSWKGRFKIWLMLMTANKIIVPDERFIEIMDKLPFISRNKIEYIPVGPNIIIPETSDKERQRKRQIKGLSEQDIVIGFWGYLEPSKGLETLLEAYMTLGDRHENVYLSLLSSIEPLQEINDKQSLINREYRAKIKDFLDMKNGPKRVLQPKSYDTKTLQEELALVDLFVLPFVEGASSRRSTLISALQNESPVISTININRKDETLKELLLVKPGDVNELSETIEKIISEPGSLKKLKQNSISLSHYFDWDRIAKKHVSLYTQFNKDNRQKNTDSRD